MSSQASQSELISKVDGLIIRDSGPWIKRKHFFLKEYMKIFTIGMNKKWPGRLTFVDMYSGPGRCFIDSSEPEEDGSPLLSLKYPFSKYIFVEESPKLLAALKTRCSNSPKRNLISLIQGDCNERTEEIISKMPSQNLNFVFIDPTDIDIHFETVRKLSEVANGVDLLMNIQHGMDMKRNFETYRKQGKASKLQRFMGKDMDVSGIRNAQDAISIYKERLNELGYRTVRFREVHVKNSKNAPMYFLLFASRHQTGLKFWNEISKKDEQGQYEFHL